MVFLSNSPAIAVVKSGSKCSKLNSTTTLSGYKYTCIKSGKILIWSKGVKVTSSPTPKPSPSLSPSLTPTLSPSPSPTLSPSPTPSPSMKPIVENDSVSVTKPIVYRYINGILERQASISGKYFTTDSRKESDFDQVRVKAFQEIRSKISNSPHINLVFNWDIKKDFPLEIAAYSKDYVEAAASFWGWVFKEPISVPAQLVTEKDLEWQKAQDVKFSDTVDLLIRMNTAEFKNQNSFLGGGAHYWFRSPEEPKLYTLLNFQTPSFATTSYMGSTWVMVPAHEVTHIIQDYYRKGIGDPDVVTSDRRTHATFQEGTATLFGYGIAMKNLGWYSDGLDEFLYSNFKYEKFWKPVKTVDDVIEILEATEARTNEATHSASYPVGALLYEWVIAKFGFESYVHILENLASNPNYSDTIQAALGISKDEMYKGAAPYILAAFKRVGL